MGEKHSISKVMLMFAWLMLCVNSVFAAWDGKEMVKPARDTKNDKVCIIDTEAKLAWYAVVNKDDNDNNYTKCDAKLTADLDMGGKLWIPIAAGTGTPKYSKIFDGNGHIIKNLYINGDSLYRIDKNYAQNLGFVAVLGNGAIKNLILENVEIQASTSTGEVLSNTADDNHQISVGAFVGWMNESGSNNVEKCMASGVISTTGKGQGVGGIVGNAKKGKISNCLSLVEIRTSGSDAYVGGIIGITKDAVTVSSCVYAGPGLINIGIKNGGSVGGIAGNVYSGKLTVQDDFYEGEDNLQLYGAKCFGNFNDEGKCKSSPSVKDASSADVDGNVGRVNISNQDSVACHLNGMNADKTCKTEPWAVGETNLSLFGYGADGYMIVFYANGGKYADGSEARNKFFDAGMVINADDIVPPSDEERTFVGWALTRNATAPVENLGTVSKSDTVFAVWQEKLTVIFNVSPGVFPDENVDVKTKKVDKGGLVTVGGLGTLPTSYCAEKIGDECVDVRYFTGWATKINPAETDTIHLDTLKANKNELTLYAVWTADETYTVTYNANGHGKTRVDYVRVKNGKTIGKPQDPVAHDGYAFVYWFTKASCEDGSDFSFETPITESIVLYAKWVPQKYTITYVVGKDGLANSEENPSEYNIESETINLKAPTPVNGKTFEGWFNDAAFSKKVTRIAKGSFGNKTFYAKYSTKTYRISYLADNYSYGSVSDQFKEHGSSITLLSSGNFSRAMDADTYEHIGWAESPNGEKKYELGDSYEIDASLILYPAWSHKRYTITYKCDGCVNSANPKTYTIDDAVVFEDPEKDGYTFVGWYGNGEFNGDAITGITKGTTGDTTLFAKWNGPIEYTITYNTNEGTLPDDAANPQTYTVEHAVTLPVPTKNGYTFEGWFDKDGKQVTEIAKGTTGDTTLFAKWDGPIEYTITYNNIEGATNENPVTYTVESETINLADAVKNGYKFEGWFDKDGKQVTEIVKGTTGDTTLYAKWNGPIEYTIIYNNVEGATNNNQTTYTVESETIQLANAVKNGYDFVGWYDSENNQVSGIAKGSTGDTTLFAKWDGPIEYTITYNNIEGATNENPVTYTVESGDITLSAPTKNGYDFVGWYDSENNQVSGIAKGTTGDTTLYAKWEGPIEYTITYNNIEGATNENPTTYTVESDTIQLVAAVKAGYDFAGWFDKDGEEVTAIAKGSTGNIELTAKWEGPIAYTISVNVNGGTLPEGEAIPETYTVESVITLPIPTKKGYDFIGWYDGENKKVTEIANGSTGDIELTAKWKIIEYKIVYQTNCSKSECSIVDNNGISMDSLLEKPQYYNVLLDFDLPIPTKNGYTFGGWYDKEGEEGKLVEKIAEGSTGDITLYARWTLTKYVITYELKGGKLPEGVEIPQTYTFESENVDLPTPTKSGYTFAGWYDQSDNYIGYTIYNQSSGDITLYAKWNGPIEYTIAYNNIEGATNENPVTYTVESETINLADAVKNGYEFVGWFDKNDKLVTEIAKGTTGDTILYAKWNAVEYTITYVTANGANSQPNVVSYTVEDVAGDKVIDLKPATRCGFEFAGWFKDKDLLGDAVAQIKNGDAENITLYPKWEKITNPVEDYGAVKIYEDKNGLKCAAMDGYFNGSVEIGSDVEVSYVTLDREFLVNETAENKLSTIVLPFNIAKSNIVGASFYEMLYVISQNTENQKRGVYISPTNDDVILANKPYIIRTTKANLTFNIDKEANQKVTLNTSESKNTMTDDNQWTLVGMYRYKKWLENDKELGYAYGYTAKSTNKLAAGQFDENEAGAYIVPFRAYLLNVPPKAIAPRPFLAKSASTTKAVNDLSQTASLDVFVIDGSVAQKSEIAEIGENGGMTSIITVKTFPVRMKIREGWYDMKGRRLNSKPSAKGIYYYNGKKIRIQ